MEINLRDHDARRIVDTPEKCDRVKGLVNNLIGTTAQAFVSKDNDVHLKIEAVDASFLVDHNLQLVKETA